MLSRLRELTKSFGSQVGNDDQRIELLRTKAEVEKNVTRILELIKCHQEEERKGKRSKASEKDIEVVRLVGSVYREYESLYALCDQLIVDSRNFVDVDEKKREYYSDEGSDVEYFSSNEIEINDATKASFGDDQVVELRLKLASMDKENEVLGLDCCSAFARVEEEVSVNGDLKVELLKKEREISGLVRTTESNERQLLDQINDLEGRLREKSYEAIQLGEKSKGLQSWGLELESVLKEKECQHCVLLKRLDEDERHFKSIIEEFDVHERNITLEIDSLHAKVSEFEVVLENILGEVGEPDDLKIELEAQLERKNAEINSSCLKIGELEEELENILGEVEELEDKNTKLEAQLAQEKEEHTTYLTWNEGLDEEVTVLSLRINDSEDFSDRSELEEKKTQITITSNQNNSKLSGKNRDKPNLKSVKRKMEDMVEKFRIGFEDKLRLLSQRILITEQLLYEAKESYKVVIDRYREENKGVEEKILSEFKKMKYVSESAQYALVNELDLFVGKFEEQNANFSNRISKASIDLKIAKRWVNGATSEIKRLKHNVDCLVAYLEYKEEQEVLLRDKIWKLEAKMSKEGGERLNMMQEISQLEKRLIKYERVIKEKDDRLLSLGAEKIEAIKQLCISVDYHRNRVDLLKLVISTMR